MPTVKICPRCKGEKVIKTGFYYKDTNLEKRVSPYCKDCQAKNNKEACREFRKQCLSYKGNKCEVCGYDKYLEVLMLSPKLNNKFKFTEETKVELDRRKLFCPTCLEEALLVKEAP